MIEKIDAAMYNKNPTRYSLVSGASKGAPFCPYGNTYAWIGYDKQEKVFVRFTKSVFKRLI